jgi:hypothetical protein
MKIIDKRWYRNPKNKKEWLHGDPETEPIDVKKEIEELKHRIKILEENQ